MSGFEPTTTEFRSDALTDRAIRPWVQLALRANFAQLLQFIYIYIYIYIYVYIFWKFYSIHYTLEWNTAIKKIYHLDKINITKNAFFFLSWALTHHNFTLNLQFISELKHKTDLSKSILGFSIFNSFSLSLKFIFLFNKKHWFFGFKTY